MYLVRKKYTWSYKQYHKIVISLFLVNIVYSGALSMLLLSLWKLFARETYGQGGPLVNTSLIIIIAACFITNIYEILFLNREMEHSQSMVEQLNIAKAQAELQA